AHPVSPLTCNMSGQCIATYHECAQHRERVGFRQRIDGHWRQECMSDLTLPEQCSQGQARHQLLGRSKMKVGAAAERGHNFPNTGIETERGELKNSALTGHA
ncbi:hypothetical protein VL00_38805, partial [Burkholderia cepacia]